MTGGDPGERPTELYWDPFDVEIDADPYRIWERMRDEQPVYRNDRYDFWALTRFADVEAAHKDHRSFSSAHGTVPRIPIPFRPICIGICGWGRHPSDPIIPRTSAVAA